MNLRYVFNPFSGSFEQVIVPLTKQEIISSILIVKNEETGELDVMFDEDSILYADDDYIA